MSEDYEGFLVVTDESRACMKSIKAKGKGSVVKHLRGLYTSSKEAKKAIDNHLRGKSNGKTKSTS